MTILASERNSRRDEYAAALAALTALVAVEHLAQPVAWRLDKLYANRPVTVCGQMSSGDVRSLVNAIAPYAEYLDRAEWQVDQYEGDPSGRGALHLYGSYGGVWFDLWGGLSAAELAEAARMVAVAEW